jgi:hypothetical protein
VSLARVWMIPVQQQITKQFFRAGGLKAFEPALVVMDPEIAEELNSQHCTTPRVLSINASRDCILYGSLGNRLFGSSRLDDQANLRFSGSVPDVRQIHWSEMTEFIIFVGA